MERDSIEQLVRQADRGAGPPPDMPDDLAGRVRLRSRRRRRVRVTAGALAACAALVVAGWLSGLRARQAGTRPALAGDSSIQRQLLEIAHAADQLRIELAARPLTATEAGGTPVNTDLVSSTPGDVAQQLERAAFLTVYQGDRYYRELGMPESASASYRATIRLFPQTRAARTAEARLAEIAKEEGKTL